MRTHEAGPTWLREPDDVNALYPGLWAAGVERDDDGVLRVGGLSVKELATEFGTPLFVVDENDFRSRARTFRDAFGAVLGGADVYYAGKAFLSVAVARWIADEGLSLDVCSGGELAVALRAGFPPERIGLHGNNKSVAELARALEAGVGRIIVDSFEEIERLAALATARGLRADVLIRTKVGVEAHTHEYIATAHEDQKFGFSIASGEAAGAIRAVLKASSLRLLGLHSHIGSQIYDTAGFEVAARRVLRLQAEVRDEHRVELPELDLGGGFGIAYTSQDHPQPPAVLAANMAEIIAHECAGYGLAVPRLSVEPGRSVAGPSTFTLYEVGTVKSVPLDGGHSRRYVAVDGGMTDNIRTALYDADYSCTLASRGSSAAPVLARVVGKHCESGDIVVKDEFLPDDIAAGDLIAVPGTGAYGRSMASNYNLIPRAAVVAVRDGDARLIMRRETEDDMLALDVG
ncbi:diaminopimelate decarboxylase [Jiangella alkaliphila]|uniref:Diaminopimelate decarboxylase n=1 Tax=Jiangella alkaliphila TaxID=419479 RepID=A0A1H2JJR3_9ACTN|nr:diaminopimelate decarboxylase [Jiangella alkaliphila]SDU56690.1 diaminopimelate decarboxylase [Jiangella alkaliphila]